MAYSSHCRVFPARLRARGKEASKHANQCQRTISGKDLDDPMSRAHALRYQLSPLRG